MEIENLLTQTTRKLSYSRPTANVHSFYLFEVEHPEEYVEWYDIMRNCSEQDIIRIHINSPGGQLHTAIQMMRCLQESQATIICSVEGECMSAATMIFLQADIVEVSDHSMFMFHNYSGGTYGKGGEMIDQLTYERDWSYNLLSSVYKDFLTEEEIDQIMANKDLWMSGNEVIDRMSQKAEKLKIQVGQNEGEV